MADSADDDEALAAYIWLTLRRKRRKRRRTVWARSWILQRFIMAYF